MKRRLYCRSLPMKIVSTCRFHVVVEAAPTGALEERERPFVRVEHHLLRLTRIGAHEHHAAAAKSDVGDLQRHRCAVQHDDLMAPVELIGFAGRKRQRHIGVRRRARMLPAPLARVTANGVRSRPHSRNARSSSNSRISVSRSRAETVTFAIRSRSRSCVQLPNFGRGCVSRS